ncbi:MAG TPA: bifunctional 5,10-methylenetetrahydrofolate dehydrogenase/5,10-methenyltetrahydrofolate cyclohydrolase [Patescibacteria group bacterium]|nr:bifunctional 5,10-methylenetetrahydrofolate dehydrogenase/5,10-methenyltetrahydrofolate cyclohydrolase [Patescibacteria group bacterium]
MENNSEQNNLIDGRALASKMFAQITEQVAALNFKPVLCDVVVGNDLVSLSYVNIKGKRAKECGMDFSLVQLPDTATDEQVIAAIHEQQENQNLCGLIVQLPLPAHLDSAKILQAINLDVDVDGINPQSAGQNSQLVPPTAGAIMAILDSLPVNLVEQKFVVLGNGDLVGKPVSSELKKRNYATTTVLADTENRAAILQSATVIISGVGKTGILTGDQVSEGVIVVDAGTSEQGGSISGDVDFATVAPKAKFITPSPGGVGPVTVAKLLENVLLVAKRLDINIDKE